MNRLDTVGAMMVLALTALPAPVRAQPAESVRRQPQEVEALRRQLREAVETARPGAPQGFSVVLVLGDLQGGTTQDNVPPAARKALTDMKDFLPYKSYRLLDVQWTLCCGGRAPVVSRLRGPDGHDYELTLTAALEQPRLSVRFVLREPAGAEQVAGGTELIRQLELEAVRLELEHENLRRSAERRFEVGTGKPPDEDPEVRQARLRAANASIKLAEAKQRRNALPRQHPDLKPRPGMMPPSAMRSMIDTSFTMDVGETVVVGTSRLAGGDKALIALLTAVPRNAAVR
jgi:hypothetical protein